MTTASIDVLVVNSGGVNRVSCSGDFVRPNCNIDLTGSSVSGRPVRIVFSLASGSTPGITFPSNAAEGMWIVDRALAGPTGEPTEPYRGQVFQSFRTTAGGKRLEVVSANNDSKVYQYALRFELPTQTGELNAPSSEALVYAENDAPAYTVARNEGGRMVMDPEIKNGGKN